MNKENDVILAVLKLSRAMRRCTPPPPPPAGLSGPEGPGPDHPGRPAPCAPAVGRLLACVAENPNVSSRDLCEILDLRRGGGVVEGDVLGVGVAVEADEILDVGAEEK